MSNADSRARSFGGLAALAVAFCWPGIAPGQDLGQVEVQFKAAAGSGRNDEAERLARLAIRVADGRRDPASAAYWNVQLGEFLIRRWRHFASGGRGTDGRRMDDG